MPRLKRSEERLYYDKLRETIRGRMRVYHVSTESAGRAMGTSESTFFARMRKPESLTLFEANRLAAILNTTLEDLLSLKGF